MKNTPIHRHSGLLLAVVAVLAFTALLWQSGAQASQAANQQMQPARVAVVDIELVFDLDEVKEREVQFTARQAERQKKVDELQSEFDSITTKLQEDVMSQSERNELVIRRTELEGQIKGYVNGAKGAINAETQLLATEMYEKLIAAVADVAKRMNIDVVLSDDSDITQAQSFNTRNVLFRADRLDITQIVLNDMNAAYAAGAKP